MNKLQTGTFLVFAIKIFWTLAPERASIRSISHLAERTDMPLDGTNVGFCSLVSVYNVLLQSWDNYEVHASNPNRHEEETWNYWKYADDKIALQSWKYKKYLSHKPGTNEIIANRDNVGDWETWKIIHGEDYGVKDRICLMASDGWTLATNRAGDNYPGNQGEVYVSNGAPSLDPGWAGWWHCVFDPREPLPAFP